MPHSQYLHALYHNAALALRTQLDWPTPCLHKIVTLWARARSLLQNGYLSVFNADGPTGRLADNVIRVPIV